METADLIEACIPIFIGLVMTLYGFRILGKRPGSDPRWDTWHDRQGKHLRIFGPFVALVGVFMGLQGIIRSASANDLQDSPFGVTGVGTTWVYQAPNGDFTVKVVAHETLNGSLCARREYTQNGKVMMTDHVRPEGGVFRKHAFNGGLYVPPIPLVYESQESPFHWKYVSTSGKAKLDGEQSEGGPIQSPLGKYDRTTHVILRGSDPSGEQVTESWYAEGVGLVRELTKLPSGEVLLELKSFTPAKGR
jgi:hypothetical protein